MMEVKDNIEGGEAREIAAKDIKDLGKRKNAKVAIWRKKVARYLAFCVDGGLLQSKFNLVTMIKNIDKLDTQ